MVHWQKGRGRGEAVGGEDVWEADPELGFSRRRFSRP